MPITTICIIISLALSLAAIIISYRTYLFNIKQPQENRIFEEKVKIYNDAIKAMNDSINVAINGMWDKADIRNKNDLREIEADVEDEMDETLADLFNSITNNSLMFPDNIMKLLDDFSIVLEDINFSTKRSEKMINDLEDSLNHHFDAIVNKMRADLNFETLNHSLSKRTRGKKTYIIHKKHAYNSK